jgi:hypothetical protein
LLGHTKRVGLAVDPGWLPEKLVEELFEHLVVSNRHASTFMKHFPPGLLPLT